MKILLSAIKEFQTKFPTAHVGGSIGLFLHGIDLQRDLSKSDIDMTVDEPVSLDNLIKENIIQESSSPTDFDNTFRYFTGSVYSKMELRVSPEPSFIVINYQGIDYNVSLLRNILFWKKKYALKNIQKHIDDLITIETGIRPIVVDTRTPQQIEEDSLLPF